VLVGRNGAARPLRSKPSWDSLPARGARELQGRTDNAHANLPARAAWHRLCTRDAGIFPDLSVAENFRICKWLTRRAAKATGALTRRCRERIFGIFPEINAFIDRRGLHLSGGQKKMVAVARAMASASICCSRAIRGTRTGGCQPLTTRSTGSSDGGRAPDRRVESDDRIRIADRLYAMDRGEIISAPADAVENEDVMRTLRG